MCVTLFGQAAKHFCTAEEQRQLIKGELQWPPLLARCVAYVGDQHGTNTAFGRLVEDTFPYNMTLTDVSHQ